MVDKPLGSRLLQAWNLDQMVLLGLLMALFFMPLSEKLKAAGFWIALGAWVMRLIRERDRIRTWIPAVGWALLVFAGVALLSAVFSDYPNRATRGALDALRNALLFVILVNTVDSGRRIRWVLLALTGGILIGDLVAIHQYFTAGPPFEMLSLGEKNSTAQVLSFFLALMLGLLLAGSASYLSALLLPVTALTLLTLGLTYARGIWVGVAAALVLYVIVLRNWRTTVALAVLLVTVLTGMSFSEEFTRKIASLKNPLTAPNMVERYEIWKESLEIAREHPWLGIGHKTYGLAKEKYPLRNPTHAHNLFINVAVELGVLGFAALMAMLASIAAALVRMRAALRSGPVAGFWLGGLGSLAVLLIGGIAHPMLGAESSMMLVTVLGLLFATYRSSNSAERNFQIDSTLRGASPRRASWQERLRSGAHRVAYGTAR